MLIQDNKANFSDKSAISKSSQVHAPMLIIEMGLLHGHFERTTQSKHSRVKKQKKNEEEKTLHLSSLTRTVQRRWNNRLEGSRINTMAPWIILMMADG